MQGRREVSSKPWRTLGRSVQAPILLAIVLASLFAGSKSCGRDVTPQSLSVFEVVPREVEIGDRVAILGVGFPPGKPARVTFRGALHRPGERPVLGAEIVVFATPIASGRLELAFDEPTQALFTRAGDRAAHTTFEGDVEVAFAAPARGAAPIAGNLEHVVLDVRPSNGAGLSERNREGERALAWIGVRAVAGGSGLVIEEVKPGSPAQAAAIAAGDVLTGFDGVRVASPADVLPPPGQRTATIQVRSAQDGTSQSLAAESTRFLSVDGFRRSPPAELVGAALAVLIALIVVWLFGAPGSPNVAAAMQRIASRTRDRIVGALSLPGASPSRMTPARRAAPTWTSRRAVDTGTIWRAFAEVAREALPPYGPAALADLAPCALLAALPFGQYVIPARLDVGLLFVGAATMLASVAFVLHRSAWGGALAAARVAWQHVPAAAAVASIVVATGSLRIQEIEAAQGGWPWDWLAFRSPAAPLALGLLLACTWIEPSSPRKENEGLVALLEKASVASAPSGHWREAACRAHRVVIAGLASVLFLGGWLLPGVAAAEQFASPALEIVGAAWLLGKTCALVLMMTWVRWCLPGWRLAAWTRTTVLQLFPLSIGALATTAAWSWWSPSSAAQFLVSTTLVAIFGLGVIALVHRLRHALISPVGDCHLSTFL